MTERPALETERCGKCGRPSAFEWDDDEQGFVSVCCHWSEQPLPDDAEPAPPDA